MKEDDSLQSLLRAGRLPGFRALRRFWAAVGLTLGVGTALLGYLGPPEADRSQVPGVDAASAADHAAASGGEAAAGEPSQATWIAAASSSAPPPQPAPAPDSPLGMAGMATPLAVSDIAGLPAGAQAGVPVDGPPAHTAEASGVRVEAPRRLRIHTGELNIALPETPGGDTPIVTIRAVPRGTVRNGTAILKAGDRLRPEELAALVFVPEPGFTGPAGSLRYLVEDSHGRRAESALEIDVMEAATQSAAAQFQARAASPAAPPRVVLATNQGVRPVYRIGDSMTLRIQPTQDAYIYCYYQDDMGGISRIFPNRFQPDAFVPARVQIMVPPAGSDAFSIRFDRAGAPEQVACLAADRDVEHLLPQELARQDLETLPVHGLDEVAQRFHNIAGVQIDDARLPIEVTGRRVNGK